MGIARDDKAGRYDAWLRNYGFFDAPHVAIVACDRRLGPYAYVDVGVWLGYVLTAAAGARHRDVPDGVGGGVPRAAARAAADRRRPTSILFGIALGHADAGGAGESRPDDARARRANVTFVAS